MTRTIKQISPLARVQIKEDTRDDNDALFETCLEEVQAVGDGLRKALEIKPEVECRVWDGLDVEPHLAESGDDIVAFALARYQKKRWEG
jgi:hypothetical protein